MIFSHWWSTEAHLNWKKTNCALILHLIVFPGALSANSFCTVSEIKPSILMVGLLVVNWISWQMDKGKDDTHLSHQSSNGGNRKQENEIKTYHYKQTCLKLSAHSSHENCHPCSEANCHSNQHNTWWTIFKRDSFNIKVHVVYKILALVLANISLLDQQKKKHFYFHRIWKWGWQFSCPLCVQQQQ